MSFAIGKKKVSVSYVVVLESNTQVPALEKWVHNNLVHYWVFDLFLDQIDFTEKIICVVLKFFFCTSFGRKFFFITVCM